MGYFSCLADAAFKEVPEGAGLFFLVAGIMLQKLKKSTN